MSETFTALVMAAGRGTRMRSSLPKVLHPVCGKPMVEWVIAAARAAGADRVVCIVRPGDGVAEGLPADVEVAEQRTGEGTGAAILAAREAAGEAETVVVLSGDTPLISAEAIGDLVATHRAEQAAATLLSTDRLDPAGYGRIIRASDGSVQRIVETKHPGDGTPQERAVREINIGLYAFSGRELWAALDAVGTEHGEIYLTGVFPSLRSEGHRLASHLTADIDAAQGINSRADLMEAEVKAQRGILRRLAESGVTFLAPETVRIEAGVEIGPDSTVGPGVTLRGATTIGTGCAIGPQTTITDSRLADGAEVVHSFLVGADLAEGAVVGPFAYLRPGAKIGSGAKVGTFVEIKNSDVGPGAKVPHLSYLGDADVGANANVAAGNITANYDGFAKHRTQIGEGARTGVHTSLVAPVAVGAGAYIGAGSVITGDVPEGALGIARSRQRNIEGYAERVEKERR